MRNIFCAISAILFYANSYLFPQNADTLKLDNSLEQEILAQEDTSLEIIIKSRNMILENLSTGNLVKAKELIGYLEQKFKETEYMPLWYVEKLFLSYCVKDYEFILNGLKSPESDKIENYKKIFPPKDQLEAKLGAYVSNKYTRIKGEISSSGLSEEEKDFLNLTLAFMLYRFGETPFASQEELNAGSDIFLKKYPNTVYKAFVRDNIRYVLKLSDFGWGIVISAGRGGLTGDLKNYFTSYTPISMSLELDYKKWRLYLLGHFGSCETNADFIYNGNWKKGTDMFYNMLGASIGRTIYEDNYIKIIPSIGITGSEISPPPAKVEKGEVEDLSLGYVTGYSLGLTADWKVYSFQEEEALIGLVSTDICLRLTGGYIYPAFQKEDNRFTGNSFFITLGIGAFGRKISRDY